MQKTKQICFDPPFQRFFLNKNELGDYAMYHAGKVMAFSERMDSVLFHELCHALHNLDGTVACERQMFVPVFYKLSHKDELCQVAYENWTDDEEIYAITGWYVDSKGNIKFDCLNTNSYMILEELKKGTPSEKIQQGVFHCDYPTLTTKYRLAKKLPLNGLVIPLEKYVDVKETVCQPEDWMDMR